MCRIRRVLVVLRNYFHFSMLYIFFFPPFSTNFSSIIPHNILAYTSCLPLSLVASKFIYNTFLEILFSSMFRTCPNQRNQFNLITSVIVGFSPLHKFHSWLIFSNLLFHCHILVLKFFYTLSFQTCLFALYLYLLVSKFYYRTIFHFDIVRSYRVTSINRLSTFAAKVIKEILEDIEYASKF